MCPVLFHIGSFPVRSFGLVLMVGFLVGIWMARRRASRFGLDGDKLWDLAILLIVFGVLGSRLAFIVQEWEYFSQNRSEIFSLQFDGLTSFGGIILGLVVMAIWTRRTKTSFLSAMDVFAVPFLVASAIGRVGCLLNGCCYGGPTGLPWGVHFEHVPGAHHPAQIYDSLMVLVGAAFISWSERRRLAAGASLVPGRSMSLMFLVYGLSRFIYEFWRAGQSSTYWGSLPITQAQAMAGFLAVLGLVLYVFLGRRHGSHPREAPA